MGLDAQHSVQKRHTSGHSSRAWASAVRLGHLRKDRNEKSHDKMLSFEIVPRTCVTASSSPREKN